MLSFCSPVQGQYDRVHCGAACPTSKLGPLLDLLRPEGGLIVTPVEPSDLRVIIKKPDGAVTSRIISQVRYSTLEVGQPAGTPLIDRHHWFHVFDHLAHITPSPKVPPRGRSTRPRAPFLRDKFHLPTCTSLTSKLWLIGMTVYALAGYCHM